MFKDTSARLSVALMGYFTLVILLLTLNPFYLVMPSRIYFTLSSDLSNLISNIVLFIPLGFFYRLATQQKRAYIFGFILSLSIESLQLFIPARTPSVVDVIANTVGAEVGTIIYSLLRTQISLTKGLLGQLRLETPLMGVVYLMVPLVWSNTLSLHSAPNRWVLTTFILLCIVIVLSELFRHWWKPVTYQVVLYAALVTGVWCILGLGSTLLHSTPLVVISLGSVLLTAILTFIPNAISERRFERTTLRRVIPIFILYLIGSVLWPLNRSLTTWHVVLGFTNLRAETSLQSLNPRIEYLIAFTVLGYLLAEWRGREELSLAQDLPGLFGVTLGISLFLELLAGFQVGPGVSLVRVVMVLLGALFGGTIYHLLRAHIRFLLGR